MINAFCGKPLWECARALADVAQGRRPADIVVKGARLVNVCTAEVQDSVDVAIAEGRVAFVGRAGYCIGPNTQVIDAQGCYIAPGFLDGHVHVESSMVGAGEFARAVVPHGTTGIYWDPHEVCNVLGLEGVRVMLEDVRRTPLKAMVTTPSCVPAVPGFEDAGAAIGPDDIAETMAWDSVEGLGEMMNFVGIVNGAEQPHAEVAETLKAGKVVTGHCASLDADRGLNAYAASGVRCCHESTRVEDALAKMRLGLYAQLRFGSAGRDLPQLAAAVTSGAVDARFACLVTDDVHPHELVEDGHMDRVLREAVRCGIQRGAMASTVAHDAHNLFVVGTNDADMALAANALIACGGGQVVVADGEVLALMELPIAGIMADVAAEEASRAVHALERAWRELGCAISAPFMTMAFIPLACLPELRLTDRGLVDCTTFQFAQLTVGE